MRLSRGLLAAPALLLAIGLCGVRYLEDSEERRGEALAEVEAWDRAQADWAIGRRPEAWLSYPPTRSAQGKTLLAEVGVEGWARGPGGREALVVSWGAEGLEGEAPWVMAASTASLLGFRADGDPRSHADRALAAQEALREIYAPDLEAKAFPPVGPADVAASSSLSAQRMLRSGVETQDSAALGGLIAAVRRGEDLAPSVWSTPGHCGMAALELGRRGRVEDLEILLRASIEGPTATDRLASLYAARRLAPVSQWPPGPARERALRVEG